MTKKNKNFMLSPVGEEGSNSYYFTGPYSVGAYLVNHMREENGKKIEEKIAILFDSGIDESTAKNIDESLSKKNITVGAIINTHSHADHCGGNHYFQRKNPSLKIYATTWEAVFIEQPKLEPSCFCGGAEPFSELRTKLLEAQPSRVTNVIAPYEDQVIDILGHKFKIITLPGHTNGMIGIITPDNVLYCGDAFFGDSTFNKHGILFYTNIEDTLKSLEKLKKLNAYHCVFYHGAYGLDSGYTAEKHIVKVKEIANSILNLIEKAGSISIDQLTQKAVKEFNIPDSIVQFTLTRTCINAYVTYWQALGKIKLAMQDGLAVIVPTAKEEKNSVEIGSSKDSKQEVIEYVKVEPNKLFSQSTFVQSTNHPVFSSFAWDIKNDKTANLTITLLPDEKFSGEMHVDAKKLQALEMIVNALKGSIAKNVPTLVLAKGFDFNGTKLTCKKEIKFNQPETECLIDQIEIGQDTIVIKFKNLQKRQQQIVTDLMHESNICLLEPKATKLAI